MASTIAEQLTLDPAVDGFLRMYDAQPHLLKVVRLARECFPTLISIDATLQEDPDDDARAQVLVCAYLPESIPDEKFRAALLHYHERCIEELPLSHCPLFALVTEFVAE